MRLHELGKSLFCPTDSSARVRLLERRSQRAIVESADMSRHRIAAQTHRPATVCPRLGRTTRLAFIARLADLQGGSSTTRRVHLPVRAMDNRDGIVLDCTVGRERRQMNPGYAGSSPPGFAAEEALDKESHPKWSGLLYYTGLL